MTAKEILNDVNRKLEADWTTDDMFAIACGFIDAPHHDDFRCYVELRARNERQDAQAAERIADAIDDLEAQDAAEEQRRDEKRGLYPQHEDPAN